MNKINSNVQIIQNNLDLKEPKVKAVTPLANDVYRAKYNQTDAVKELIRENIKPEGYYKNEKGFKFNGLA